MSTRYFPGRTVLFEQEQSGVTYRVPALLYIPQSATLLAFAEERLSPNDAHANLLVLRRGTFYRNYVEWEDMRALETATLDQHRSMNPCPVYDEFTGTVFLFFIAVLGSTPEAFQIITGQNAARLCYVYSSDEGHNWSSVTDLTQEVIGSAVKDWATFALGPGHGIQLKSGRLLVPAYTYHIDCTECFGTLCRTTPHSFTFYSDDNGHNWRFGEFIPNLRTVECQLVSVNEEDGSNVLYCNARSPLGYRVQALSTDDGAVFHPGQLVRKLVEPPRGCHGSIVGFPAPLACTPAGLPLQEFPPVRQRKLRLLLRELLRSNPPREGIENVTSTSGPLKPLESRHTKNSENPSSRSCEHGDLESFQRFSLAKEPRLSGPESISKPETFFQTPTWVLYSHPTSARSRVNMGVYLSTFPRDANSWTEPWIIYEGPSGYSDLAYIGLPFSGVPMVELPAVAFACLYENGTKSSYEQISFSMFTLYEVMENIPMAPRSPIRRGREGNKGRFRTCTTS
ncbi:sialidase-4 isoform X2 [Ornithorhynchus anatinus]|nr:sialidase-4 isoform X2 [Ornithorhynchus anatinus]